ncbi:MAG: hypothetical protein AB1512_14375 [Thermodesulfobacteriota bacterium]
MADSYVKRECAVPVEVIIMRRWKIPALGLVLWLGMGLSCGEKPSGQGRPIARVNDYVITEKDFCREIADCTRFHSIQGLTLEDRKEFLDGQIKKELLIQAAVSQGLDKEDEFRQAIERYWEQSLLMALLKRQGSRLEREILVTREEMQDLYRQLLAKNAALAPFEQMLSELERQVREMKKTRAMDEWVEALRKNARITIYEENLKGLR